MIIQYIVIVGLILLISWTVRYMVQREVSKSKHRSQHGESGRGRERT